MLTCLSQVPLPENTVVIFDLDDTLYKEHEYVRSGFVAVASYISQENTSRIAARLQSLWRSKHRDPFRRILDELDLAIDKSDLIKIYRDHHPDLSLSPEIRLLLEDWKDQGKLLGLLTDGRSKTQRNKIRALKIEKYFQYIAISEEIGTEKPSERNYRLFEKLIPNQRYVYVGDNLAKDFVTPNKLGWTTIAVRDQGHNIHSQDVSNSPKEFQPNYFIERIA